MEKSQTGASRRPSFYEKLADGRDVSIVALGDSIIECYGASDDEHRWVNMLAEGIRRRYGVRVRLTNLAMGGNNSFSGYVRAMALDDGVEYDLALLCHGQNDAPATLPLNYEAFVRAVRQRWPDASLLAALEHCQKTYTEKIRTVQALAAHYDIPTVDLIPAFQENYDGLTMDGCHPNDEGQRIYYEHYMETIDRFVAARRGHDAPDMTPVNEGVTLYETFRWLDAKQFRRTGNTFTLDTAFRGSVLTLDYFFVPGVSAARILVDGEPFHTIDSDWRYPFRLRAVVMLTDGVGIKPADVRHTIAVDCGEGEMGAAVAEGFCGISVSGL